MESPSAKILSRIEKNSTDIKSQNPTAELHDLLMAEYGWIPFEQFKVMPMQTVYNLLDAAERRHKLEDKMMKKGMPKKGRKH